MSNYDFTRIELLTILDKTIPQLCSIFFGELEVLDIDSISLCNDSYEDIVIAQDKIDVLKKSINGILSDINQKLSMKQICLEKK